MGIQIFCNNKSTEMVTEVVKTYNQNEFMSVDFLRSSIQKRPNNTVANGDR